MFAALAAIFKTAGFNEDTEKRVLSKKSTRRGVVARRWRFKASFLALDAPLCVSLTRLI